jgi:hypothetical protein
MNIYIPQSEKIHLNWFENSIFRGFIFFRGGFQIGHSDSEKIELGLFFWGGFFFRVPKESGSGPGHIAVLAVPCSEKPLI